MFRGAMSLTEQAKNLKHTSQRLLEYSIPLAEESSGESDIEEIEVEPELRPNKEFSTGTFPSNSLNDGSAASSSADLAVEFRERRRTAYSFTGSSLTSRCKATTHSKSKSTLPKSNLSSPTTEESSTPGFACNICFDTASDPVLTLCGHLFCWPCLHRWLNSQSRNPLCPVCKAGCGKDKVIPVYGRGAEEKDPRATEPIPDRPKGQRPKPQSNPGYNTWGRMFGMESGVPQGHFNVQAGLGFFPTLTFQYTAEHGAQFHTNADSPQQGFILRLFLMLGIIFLIANLMC